MRIAMMKIMMALVKFAIAIIKFRIAIMKIMMATVKFAIAIIKFMIAMVKILMAGMKLRQKWAAFHQRGFHHSVGLP